MRVSKALIHTDEGRHLLPPKTRAGHRRLPLGVTTVAALRRWREENPPSTSSAVIFLTRTGQPPHPASLRNALCRLCKHAAVPYIGLHGLRHVHAMLALEATGDIYVVQRRLGHANVNVTAGIYGYSTRDDSTAAAALDRLLSAD